MADAVTAVIGQASRVDRGGHSPFTPAAISVYGLLATAIGLVATLFAMRGFSLPGPDFPVVATAAGLLLLFAWSCRARGWDRVATGLETSTILAAFCMASTLLAFATAANDMPLADAMLAAADRRVLPSFDWPTTIRALASHRGLMAIGHACYASIGWQPSVVLLACAMTGRLARCWTFVLAWMVTLFVAIALSCLLPALGPYAHFQLGAAAMPAGHDQLPWITADIVTALRDGTLRAVTFSRMEGIVTFPSFHAAAALLLAWAFWPTATLRWPMMGLNLGMIAAAVPIGGHYFVDVPAGITVAGAGIWLATWLQAAPHRPLAKEGGIGLT